MAGVFHTLARRRWIMSAICGCLLVVGGVGMVLLTSSGAGDSTPVPNVRIASVSPSSTVPITPSTPSTPTTVAAAAPTPTPPVVASGSGHATPSAMGSAAPESAAVAPPDPAPATVVMVCESPVDQNGNVSTGSSVATRVPAGTPVPAGCHLG